MLLASWLQNEAVQMTLKTYQVLDQQEGWNMICHYVPAICTFSLSHSPFQFSYSLFKLLNLLSVKSWKMNNSLNNKSCSRAFYSDRSWKICFKDFVHDILFCSVSPSWNISTVIPFLSFSGGGGGGGGLGQTECPALSSPLMLRLFLFNVFLRWYFSHFVFTLNKFVHSDAKFYRTNGCWWLLEFNSAKVRACKCSLNV